MNAYVIELVTRNNEGSTVTPIGVIAENQQVAEEDVHRMYKHLNDYILASVTVIPLYDAIIKRIHGMEQHVTFKARAAVQKGYLFYEHADGSGHYTARCKAMHLKDGKIDCLIYRDDHVVNFTKPTNTH